MHKFNLCACVGVRKAVDSQTYQQTEQSRTATLPQQIETSSTVIFIFLFKPDAKCFVFLF